MSATKPAEGRFVETDRGYMVPYTQTIPGTKVTFKMIPVPGGVVQLGPREAGEEDEDEDASVSPTLSVKLDPYWIGERELTWAEYWPFMALNTTFNELSYLRGRLNTGDDKLSAELEQNIALREAITAKPSHVDGVTAPTGLYDPSVAYYSGEEADLPAVTMTPYAARQYTKWLSVLLGADYRLPSEAEWEHAARAGEEGDQPDPNSIDGLAWYDDNSDYEAQVVGGKKPNAWGLHDTLGNVAELVLDAPSDALPESPQPLSWRAAIAAPKRNSRGSLRGDSTSRPLKSLVSPGGC